jgi:hypothetical protein
METVHDLFEAFGGPAAVGRILGTTTEHAAQMKRRKSIPVRWWPHLISAAKEQKIKLTEADLLRIHLPFSAEGGREGRAVA